MLTMGAASSLNNESGATCRGRWAGYADGTQQRRGVKNLKAATKASAVNFGAL
jgi:hypothetical protein